IAHERVALTRIGGRGRSEEVSHRLEARAQYYAIDALVDDDTRVRHPGQPNVATAEASITPSFTFERWFMSLGPDREAPTARAEIILGASYLARFLRAPASQNFTPSTPQSLLPHGTKRSLLNSTRLAAGCATSDRASSRARSSPREAQVLPSLW